jgi:hypothetical protein
MKKLIAVLVLSAFATAAYAACRTYSITQGGRTIMCLECCNGNHCTTTCN